MTLSMPCQETEVSDYNREWLVELCREVPCIANSFDSHLEEYDGSLPYVFMGNLSGWSVRQAKKFLESGDSQWDCCKQLLSKLDQWLSSPDTSEGIGNLIGAGFAENIWSYCLSVGGSDQQANEIFGLICANEFAAIEAEIIRFRYC